MRINLSYNKLLANLIRNLRIMGFLKNPSRINRQRRQMINVNVETSHKHRSPRPVLYCISPLKSSTSNEKRVNPANFLQNQKLTICESGHFSPVTLSENSYRIKLGEAGQLVFMGSR